jgi:hypothetical protein
MRPTTVGVAATVGALALVGAASSSAQQAGAWLQIEGVPATLTVPGSFTMTVSGSAGTASPASVYEIYGPAPCAATVDAQLVASPDESLLGPEAAEVPAFGLAGAFTIHAHGLGEALSSPGLYTVCAFMEAPEEPESGEDSEEENVIAVASATFTVLPTAGGSSHGTTTRGGARRCVVPHIGGSRARSARKAIARGHCSLPPTCVVPHIRGRRLKSAERAIARAHCAVGRIRRAGSRRVRKGRVLWQGRRAGSSLPGGTRVGLVISAGVSRRPTHPERARG